MCQCYLRYRVRKRKGYHVVLANERSHHIKRTLALDDSIVLVPSLPPLCSLLSLSFCFCSCCLLIFCKSSIILSNSLCASDRHHAIYSFVKCISPPSNQMCHETLEQRTMIKYVFKF
eukprot:466200_1